MKQEKKKKKSSRVLKVFSCPNYSFLSLPGRAEGTSGIPAHPLLSLPPPTRHPGPLPRGHARGQSSCTDHVQAAGRNWARGSRDSMREREEAHLHKHTHRIGILSETCSIALFKPSDRLGRGQAVILPAAVSTCQPHWGQKSPENMPFNTWK